jgi:putative DNA primase/helicase
MSTPATRTHAQACATGQACLEAALEILRLGFPPLALCPPDHVGVGKKHCKECKSPGKVPWHTWKEFQTHLPTEDEVRGWWRINCQSNVGMICGGPGRIISVDAEGDGMAAFRAHGEPPPTWQFTTGNGYRWLFEAPEGFVGRTTVDPLEAGELRIQWRGAQTVIPPSWHAKSGKEYAWVPGLRPGEIELAIAPAWLLDLLHEPAKSTRGNGKHKKTTGQTAPPDEPIREPGRNSKLASMAGSMRHTGFDTEAIYAALLVVNRTRCQPPLDDDEVRKIAESIGKYPPGQAPNNNGEERRRGRSVLPAVFTARQLDEAIIPPIVWLVAGLIPEGTYTSIQGRPKGGKSFLALQLAVCLAAGIDFLGMKTSATGQGIKVLFLALEDTEARLQKRLRRLARGLGLEPGGPWRQNLISTLERDNGAEGEKRVSGLAWLEKLIDLHKPRAAIVDTKARLIGPREKGGYQADYYEGIQLQEMALSTGTTIIATTHSKKRQEQEADHLDASQGTTGETSAQDTVMTLFHPRGTRQGRLEAAGRDLDDDLDIVLEYDPAAGPWVSLGATPPRIPDHERAATWLREFLKDGAKPGDTCVEQGNARLGMKHALPWWRDRVLKEELDGKPRRHWVGEGKDRKQEWVWELPRSENTESRTLRVEH